MKNVLAVVLIFNLLILSSAHANTLSSAGLADTQQTEASDANATIPEGQVVEIQTSDSGNDVYGAWLFQGQFAKERLTSFSPEYRVTIGDQLTLKLWGAFEAELPLTVDPQGNVFVPKVGPIAVAGVANKSLNDVFTQRIKKVFREDVGVYASLITSQPVKVFVAGHVTRPGLYSAYSADSILHFLDRAGGITAQSGSYLDIRLLRNNKVIKQFDLYNFLGNGRLGLQQFHDGDTIFVGPRGSVATITGLVSIPAEYEFNQYIELKSLLDLAGLEKRATNVEITRNIGEKRSSQYLSLKDDIEDVLVLGGDQITVLADRLIDNIVVTVEGEHLSKSQYVLPYAASLQDVMDQIKLSPQSAVKDISLYRVSVAERQKQLLNQSIDRLEASILNARSDTKNEAELRQAEASLIQQFVARARNVEPQGQVVLYPTTEWSQISLEDGDVIRVPRKQFHVNVHGEVMFPNAFAWNDEFSVTDYIQQSGGYTGQANARKVLVRAPSGALRFQGKPQLFAKQRRQLYPGDEILVMPKVDSKRFQFSSDIVQILYQTAVAAGVVLAI